MNTARWAVPLTVAGSDPSGGAGLQADLKVFLRFGLSGAAVPTALTVQSPSEVRTVEPLSGRHVARQLEALLAGMRPAAVKVGLVPTAGVAEAVAQALAPLARRGVPIVLDPVLAAGTGRRLLPRRDVAAWKRQLLPLATLVTPNLPEAAELAGLGIAAVRRDLARAMDALLDAGAGAVLLTGGHGSGPRVVDLLAYPGGRQRLVAARIPRRRAVHGTGCALSAAIAAMLAQGEPLEVAVRRARTWLRAAIRGAHRVGRGQLQLDFLAPVR